MEGGQQLVSIEIKVNSMIMAAVLIWRLKVVW